MTTKADFTPQEWELVLEGPPSAGMIVITAQRGGSIRETVSMAKTYAEARREHGQSELLDEIVAAKPEIDHTRYRSLDELKEHCLGHLRDAVSLLSAKATAQELDEYKRFIVNLSDKVAHAHREHGQGQEAVGDAERAAIAAIAQALE
jgi:head-tail adaptor